MTANHSIGKLPTRYTFILNPFRDQRVSKCPLCHRPTFLRKFVLFIHVNEFGPLALGKTCRYCSRCQLIVAHQDELEAELAVSFSRIAPVFIGNEYMVLGTMDKKVWKQGLGPGESTLEDSLQHVADFGRVLDLKVEGGWKST